MARRFLAHSLRLAVLTTALVSTCPSLAEAQLATRLAILQAEDRRAPTTQDLAVIRAGAHSADGQTAQIAVRALGRLERPTLIPDILASLRHPLADVRAEAANAVAQAAQGLRDGAAASVSLTSVQASLITRLGVEAEATVRAALCEAIARLPYVQTANAMRAEAALVDFAARANSNTDRLGLAKGFEALTRLQPTVHAPGPPVIDELKRLARPAPARTEQALLRDARVRRLAVESLGRLDAIDADTLNAAAQDPDAQVRRLAVRAATIAGTDAAVARGLTDPAAMVRIEALRASRRRNPEESCSVSLAAASDPDMNVAIIAIDQLGTCAVSDGAVAYLTQIVDDPDDAEMPRNWHRAAHGLVSLSTAAPDRVTTWLARYARSSVWQLRAFSARAAALVKRRDLLEQLALDEDDNVVEAAIVALQGVAGHEADRVYLAALDRQGYQVIRAAALALDSTPSHDAALEPLTNALDKAEDDGRPGAADARTALRATLQSLGAPARQPKPGRQPAAPLNAADLKRLSAPRARFTIRDVGNFDVALFTLEAPATVLRFAALASSGYYDGLTFHRVVPNGVVQGGSPGANEYSSDTPYMRDEVGLWPHVRGAMGISTRGRDTGDGQLFIDLVDNPRYDHTYTVFAQVLNGMDIVDRLLEGDVIEKVEIVQ